MGHHHAGAGARKQRSDEERVLERTASEQVPARLGQQHWIAVAVVDLRQRDLGGVEEEVPDDDRRLAPCLDPHHVMAGVVAFPLYIVSKSAPLTIDFVFGSKPVRMLFLSRMGL